MVVIHHHGSGGIDAQQAIFGGGGSLYHIAENTALAKYLLVARNTDKWPPYEAVSDMTTEVYGERRHPVRLYRKSADQMPRA